MLPPEISLNSQNSQNQSNIRHLVTKKKIEVAAKVVKILEIKLQQMVQRDTSKEIGKDAGLINKITDITAALWVVGYTEKDRELFLEWKNRHAHNSPENPFVVSSIDEILNLLPPIGNCLETKCPLFFKAKNWDDSYLDLILRMFSLQNPSYELAIVKQSENLISIWIGNKINNPFSLDWNYFGHYHPDHSLNIPSKDKLPKALVAGILPSYGDLRGFFKHKDAVQKGTRIYSKNGYSEIAVRNSEASLESRIARLDRAYKEYYFSLFLGQNNLWLVTDKQIQDFFKNKLGFNISFHYYS